MSKEIKIRKEEAEDAEHVREVLRAAFPTEAESKLVDALRENGNEYGVDEEFMVINYSECRAAGVVQYASEFAMFSV